MDTNDISTMWANDAPIDETNLVGESKRIPLLHSKYYNFYYREVLRVKKLKAEYKQLEAAKRDWYDGSMAEEDLRERGWRPYQKKIIRQDIDKYLQADADIIKLSLTIDYHAANANYLEDIIKTIHASNFIVKNMIDIIKFQSGSY